MNMKKLLISTVLLAMTMSSAHAALLFANPDNVGPNQVGTTFGTVDHIHGAALFPADINGTSNTFPLESLDAGLGWSNFQLTVFDYTSATAATPGVSATINGTFAATSTQFADQFGPQDTLPLAPLIDLNNATLYNVYRFTFANFALAGQAPTFVTLSGFNADRGRAVLTVTAIPEPSTVALLLAGLAAVGWVARRRSLGQA